MEVAYTQEAATRPPLSPACTWTAFKQLEHGCNLPAERRPPFERAGSLVQQLLKEMHRG